MGCPSESSIESLLATFLSPFFVLIDKEVLSFFQIHFFTSKFFGEPPSIGIIFNCQSPVTVGSVK